MSILFSMFLVLGCATGGPSKVSAPKRTDIGTLVVVPFVDQGALHGKNDIYRCGLCGGMFETGSVESGAATIVTRKVIQLLSAENAVRLVPEDAVEDVRMRMVQDNTSTRTDLELVTEIGKALGADAVLTGSVYRWVDRAGSNYAADSPASVGIDIDLVDTETGRLIWHTRLEETQQFLLDNLLKIGTFIKRGGKWVTADQMAAAGLKDVLERSPIP